MQQSDAHDAATLVEKLRASSSSADVQAECCAVLSGFTLEGDAAAEAIDAVVTALRHGVNHATLQRDGFGALAELMHDSADNRVSAAAVGAVEAIVAASGWAARASWSCWRADARLRGAHAYSRGQRACERRRGCCWRRPSRHDRPAPLLW
jgi:hypothetical protein